MSVVEVQTNLNQMIAIQKWNLTPRQFCDVECLLNGTFAPLTGFLDKEDYESVCDHMRLQNGALWPIPITLDLPETLAISLSLGEKLILTNDENTPIALLTVQSKWHPNKELEAVKIYGSNDLAHPGVHHLKILTHSWYVGGPITPLQPIQHHTFVNRRHTPLELKQIFKNLGWEKIIAFQTRNPMHRAHFELTERAALATGANLLLHPVIGMTKPGDIDAITRVNCYQELLKYYTKHAVMLSLLPLAMRMAGPREAVWHALIRKNYGATHFIIGRDHAGPGNNSLGEAFYDPYAAQDLLFEHAAEIGIEAMPFAQLVYSPSKQQFLTHAQLTQEDTLADISGTELRRRLRAGQEIPEWFTFSEITARLRLTYPEKHQQGYTVLFTGLSGAGKSTLAKALHARLQETTRRQISLLDGDELRKNLSKELGFSKQDRETHIQRLGLIAAEITKHRGIALCAAITPYATMRQNLREQISLHGGFIEVYVSTPFAVCKQRDVKGLYQQAALGLLPAFTGVQDPYEPPVHPELSINTENTPLKDAIDEILLTLHCLGFEPMEHTEC